MLLKIKNLIEEGGEYFNKEVIAYSWFFKVFNIKYSDNITVYGKKYISKLGYQFKKPMSIDNFTFIMWTKKPMSLNEMRLILDKPKKVNFSLKNVLKIEKIIKKGGINFNRKIISSTELFKVIKKKYPYIKLNERELFGILNYTFRGCYEIDKSLHKIWSKEYLSKDFLNFNYE